jgi:putative transposase
MLRKNPLITGEYYHVYNRGIDKRIIFKSAFDYRRFMILLRISNTDRPFKASNISVNNKKSYSEIMSAKYENPLVSLGAWCLMNNHFHFLIKQEVDGGITKFMKKLGTGYSMYFNQRYERKGALFGGVFKSKLIGSDDNYMRQLFAYIHLNPLDIEFKGWEDGLTANREDLISFLKNYKYSSYHDYTLDQRIEKEIINPGQFPEYFQGKKSFEEFVENFLPFLQNNPDHSSGLPSK